VTVEKRKWDGQVSGRWRALLIGGPPQSWRWCTPAGTRRDHPWTNRSERRPDREVSIGGLGHWLLTVALDDEGRLVGAEADAILPVEEPVPGLLAFVDLDLDLELDLERGRAELQDLDDFRARAASMGYPPWVQRAAWKGLWDLKRRLAAGRWPFGAALEGIVASALSTDRFPDDPGARSPGGEHAGGGRVPGITG
jgi:hypothetical protein